MPANLLIGTDVQLNEGAVGLTNDIVDLTLRGDEAIATVRQKFTRQITPEALVA